MILKMYQDLLSRSLRHMSTFVACCTAEDKVGINISGDPGGVKGCAHD